MRIYFPCTSVEPAEAPRYGRYMEDEAEKLMVENLSKNFIDLEEYSSCGEIEARW